MVAFLGQRMIVSTSLEDLVVMVSDKCRLLYTNVKEKHKLDQITRLDCSQACIHSAH
jgi:hypothetical protein